MSLVLYNAEFDRLAIFTYQPHSNNWSAVVALHRDGSQPLELTYWNNGLNYWVECGYDLVGEL